MRAMEHIAYKINSAMIPSMVLQELEWAEVPFVAEVVEQLTFDTHNTGFVTGSTQVIFVSYSVDGSVDSGMSEIVIGSNLLHLFQW